jgi:hypothetical protein
LPALEHHTYSEDDVEEGGIKIKKNGNFFEVGGFAKTRYKKIFALLGTMY